MIDGKTKPLKSVLSTFIFCPNLWLENISSDILTLDSYCKLYV